MMLSIISTQKKCQKASPVFREGTADLDDTWSGTWLNEPIKLESGSLPIMSAVPFNPQMQLGVGKGNLSFG